jgi:hypothetical protein
MCVYRYSMMFDIYLTNESQILSIVRAITRAGFESASDIQRQLHLSRALGPKYEEVHLLALSVTAIQTKQEFFQLNKKTRAFERACPDSQQGAIRPIFEGDTPP